MVPVKITLSDEPFASTVARNRSRKSDGELAVHVLLVGRMNSISPPDAPRGPVPRRVEVARAEEAVVLQLALVLDRLASGLLRRLASAVQLDGGRGPGEAPDGAEDLRVVEAEDALRSTSGRAADAPCSKAEPTNSSLSPDVPAAARPTTPTERDDGEVAVGADRRDEDRLARRHVAEDVVRLDRGGLDGADRDGRGAPACSAGVDREHVVDVLSPPASSPSRAWPDGTASAGHGRELRGVRVQLPHRRIHVDDALVRRATPRSRRRSYGEIGHVEAP